MLEKTEGQSRMDNLETLATLVTRHRMKIKIKIKTKTKQKTKTMPSLSYSENPCY
jgi:hypothetical protein